MSVMVVGVFVAVLVLIVVGPDVRAAKKPPVRGTKKPPAAVAVTSRSPMVVLGFNDLGMHCMNQDFSEICILPPYNNLHAQVIDRSGEEPRIVTSGVQVNYSIPGNTKSSTKTNFWQYARSLLNLSTPLPLDVGLTGNKLAGTMKRVPGGNDWVATGIPITPWTDALANNPFQLGLIQVLKSGKVQATTQAVVPVSWEINCNICHTGGNGLSVAGDILSRHDQLHSTTLLAQSRLGKPVLCASCHADPALGTAGLPGVKTMSAAMHGSHANRMGPAAAFVSNSCYACHPGKQTECLRDVHFAKYNMTCIDCHGDMAAVGSPTRRPWVDEPKCASCHNKRGFAFEEPGKLYKDSRGHNGVKCASCHGSPHAITPTVTAPDNVQAIALQGHAGTINDCTVCHRTRPRDAFNHSLDD
ncbi:MAG: hypothetical protein U0794_02315 [Isosphaeraceae bacterium]